MRQRLLAEAHSGADRRQARRLGRQRQAQPGQEMVARPGSGRRGVRAPVGDQHPRHRRNPQYRSGKTENGRLSSQRHAGAQRQPPATRRPQGGHGPMEQDGNPGRGQGKGGAGRGPTRSLPRHAPRSGGTQGPDHQGGGLWRCDGARSRPITTA